MTDKTDAAYQRGYRAGRRKMARDRVLLEVAQDRHDRLMTETLPGVLANCTNWKMNGEKVKNSDQYTTLTKHFVDAIIKCGPK